MEWRCVVEWGGLFCDMASLSLPEAPRVLLQRRHKHTLFPKLVNQQFLCGWWGRKSYTILSSLGVNGLVWIAWLTRLSSALPSRKRWLSEVNSASPFKVAIGDHSTWYGECSPAPDLEKWWGAWSAHRTPAMDSFSHGESGLHCT